MFTKNRGHEDSWRMKNRVKGISSWNSFFLYQSSWNEDKGQLSSVQSRLFRLCTNCWLRFGENFLSRMDSRGESKRRINRMLERKWRKEKRVRLEEGISR